MNLLKKKTNQYNAIKYFSNTPFLIINPDTIWNSLYLKELKLMERIFFEDKKKECLLLLVDKRKSFDKSFRGDFNLENYQVNRKNDNRNKKEANNKRIN